MVQTRTDIVDSFFFFFFKKILASVHHKYRGKSIPYTIDSNKMKLMIHNFHHEKFKQDTWLFVKKQSEFAIYLCDLPLCMFDFRDAHELLIARQPAADPAFCDPL